LPVVEDDRARRRINRLDRAADRRRLDLLLGKNGAGGPGGEKG
jgi:hypothetical protein